MRSWPNSLLSDQLDICWRHHVLAPVRPEFACRDRITDDHIIWAVTSGHIHVRTKEDAVDGGRGSLFWFPPGQQHSAWIDRGCRPMTAYSFRFSLLDSSSQSSFRANFKKAICCAKSMRSLSIAESLYQDCCLQDQWSRQRIKCHLFDLFTEHQRDRDASGGGLHSRLRTQLAHFVDGHIHESLVPSDLARLVNMSPDYFARQFKKAYGRSPRQWLVEQRLAKAAYLLSHGCYDIAGVARQLGYKDANFFSRQFAKFYGVPPSKYVEE